MLDRPTMRETVEVARLPLPAYVWRVVDAALVLVDCNGAARELESTIDDLVGMTLEHLEAAAPWMAASLRRAFDDRTVVSAEGEYRRSDGGVRVLSSTCVFTPPAAVVVHVEDVTERRGAEAALRASEERYRQIVETTSEGVWVIDTDERTTFVNGRMAEMLGIEPADMIGEPVTSFTGDRVPDIRATLEDRPPGAVEVIETRLRRRDGTTLWASLSSDSLRDDDGAYAGAIALVSDITERKRALNELHEAKVRFEGAFAHAPIGMAVVSVERESFGRLLAVNGALCSLLGYSEEDLLARTTIELTHPDDLEETERRVRAAVDGRAPRYEVEKRFVTAAGDIVLAQVNGSVVRDADGSVLYGIAHVEDITEQRRAAEEIEERERRFRALFSLALDAMFVADDGRGWLEVNDAAGRLLGMAPDDLIGRRLDEFSADEPAALDQLWQRLMDEGVLTGEQALRRADGDVRHVEFSARANVMPGRHLAIVRDVTERKRAEEARAQSRREAERLESALHQAQRLDTVGQLAGGVAHDFNNLLGIILNSAEFALGELDGHPAADDVRAIRGAAERAAALTRQLLVFSRREIADAQLVDINGLVADVQRLLLRTLGEHLSVEVDLGEGVPAVEADPSHLEQVLLNLAVNARDAMPDGGILRVATRAADLDECDARLYGDIRPGRHARLTVADTGCGMTPDVLERAFEPFFTTKPKGSGTGLGLATTYGIVRQNGGHIALDSGPGAGTVVEVFLPAAATDVVARPAEDGAAPQRGNGERILLVEDEAGVRDITERILTAAGYRVLSAAGPVEALAVAARDDVDLVLTDVVMPGMPGPQLVEELRGRSGEMKVVFMSGYTDRPGALPPGALFLSKPFSRRALLDFVVKALGT